MHRRRAPFEQSGSSYALRSDDGARSEGSFDDEVYGNTVTGGVVDFSHAALYMPALQIVGALGACAITTLVVNSFSATIGHVSAVRTATLTAFVGACCIWRPVRVSTYAIGVDVMFDSLRPCVVVYITALVVEQLVHTCIANASVSADADAEALLTNETVRGIFFQALSLIMCASGFAQAYQPRVQTDYPFVVVASSLVIVAMWAPPSKPGQGPLCAPLSMARSFEHVLRALLFGLTYCALAYSAEPMRRSVSEIVLCAMRAFVGSVWILCVYRYALALAVAELVLVLWSRTRHTVAFVPSDVVSDEEGGSASFRGVVDAYEPELAGLAYSDDTEDLIASERYGDSYNVGQVSKTGSVKNELPMCTSEHSDDIFDESGRSATAFGYGHGCTGCAGTTATIDGGFQTPSKHAMARVAQQLVQSGHL
jgi:hypothetical protein